MTVVHHFIATHLVIVAPDGSTIVPGVSFFLQNMALMSGNSGTDAGFPSKVRQNVVVG